MFKHKYRAGGGGCRYLSQIVRHYHGRDVLLDDDSFIVRKTNTISLRQSIAPGSVEKEQLSVWSAGGGGDAERRDWTACNKADGKRRWNGCFYVPTYAFQGGIFISSFARLISIPHATQALYSRAPQCYLPHYNSQLPLLTVIAVQLKGFVVVFFVRTLFERIPSVHPRVERVVNRVIKYFFRLHNSCLVIFYLTGYNRNRIVVVFVIGIIIAGIKCLETFYEFLTRPSDTQIFFFIIITRFRRSWHFESRSYWSSCIQNYFRFELGAYTFF